MISAYSKFGLTYKLKIVSSVFLISLYFSKLRIRRALEHLSTKLLMRVSHLKLLEIDSPISNLLFKCYYDLIFFDKIC